jgi:thioesterase domain-containing protein
VTTREFLRELRQRDVRVWLDGERVRCSAPAGVLSIEQREELARRRSEILAELQALRTMASASCIVPIEPSGSRLPFYAVPGHNGDVFCFMRLARLLGDDQPFFGLQPPGLHVGGTPIARMEELAEHFVRAILDHQPRGPYQLGGYCLGGMIAFETARQLQQRGHDVAALVLFGTSSPVALRPINRARAALGVWIAERQRGARRFGSASWPERVDLLRSKVRRAKPPTGDDDELVRRRTSVERATLTAACQYRPGLFDGRMALFVPSRSTVDTLDQPLHWKAYARESAVFFGPDSCDGDTMLKLPAAEAFADHLTGFLSRTDRLS